MQGPRGWAVARGCSHVLSQSRGSKGLAYRRGGTALVPAVAKGNVQTPKAPALLAMSG